LRPGWSRNGHEFVATGAVCSLTSRIGGSTLFKKATKKLEQGWHRPNARVGTLAALVALVAFILSLVQGAPHALPSYTMGWPLIL
jgi:hypothetical protein